MRREITIGIVTGLIGLIIGNIFSFVQFIYFDSYTNRTRVINYSTFWTGSELHVHIHNLTDRDYSDVLVYVDLFPAFGKVEIDSVNPYDHNQSRENIGFLETSSSRFGGGQRHGYLIKTLNRKGLAGSVGIPLSFGVKFYMKRPAGVQVQIDKVGIDLEQINYQPPNSNRKIFITSMIVLVGALFSVQIFYKKFRHILT